MTHPKDNSPKPTNSSRRNSPAVSERSQRNFSSRTEDVLELLSDSRENEKARQIGNWERMRIESLRSPK